MSLVKGKQLADAPNGVTTTKINDDAVTSAKVDGSVLSTDTGNVAPANDYSALGKKILSVANGTLASDAVNLSQLQAVQQGMTWKANVESATDAILPNAPVFASTPGGTATLTASANATLVVGGLNITKLGQRVLVKNEVATEQNGIYELTQAGSPGPIPAPQPWILTRATDMDATSEVPRATTTVDNPAATTYGFIYLVTFPLSPSGAWVLNTDPMTWSAIPLPAALVAGLGISITGLTISTDIEVTPSASGRGLTYVGNKLSGDIEPNTGLKFDDTTGRFRTFFASTPSVEGGLQIGTNGGLAAKLEPSSPTDGGLEIGPNAGIQVKISPTTSGLEHTATGIAVNPKTAVALDSTGGLAINGSGELVAQANTLGGLQINATNQIEAKLEPSTPITGGLQINANGGIEAKLNASGGLDYSATGLTAKLGNPANQPAGLSLSANGLYNNVREIEEFGAASVTTASGQAIFSALTQQPFRGNGGAATVEFTINGVRYRVGASIANDPIYYSSDGGVTAKALTAILVGDIPYRGGGLGFDTDATDEIIVDYLAAVP